jgi:hypothetical protein
METPLAPTTQDKTQTLGRKRLKPDELLQVLTELGEKIQELQENISSSEQVSATFEAFKQRIDNAYTTLQEGVQTNVTETSAEQQAIERGMMSQEELQQKKRLTKIFIDTMAEIAEEIQNLPPGQQSQALEYIINTGRRVRNMLVYPEPQEPNPFDRVSDIATSVLNKSIEKLSETVSYAYDKGPEKTRQAMSALSAALLLYNYQPAYIQQLYEEIPGFGHLFKMMNKGRGTLSIITNTAGTVTALYYFLRNSGVDVDVALENLKSLAEEALQKCAEAAALAASTVANTAATALSMSADAACELSVVTLRQISEILASQISYAMLPSAIRTTEQMYYRQDSVEPSSQETVLSVTSSLTDSTELSQAESLASSIATSGLLNTPTEQGGASINQNMTSDQQSIVDVRFNAILAQNSENIIVEGMVKQPTPEEIQAEVINPVLARPVVTAPPGTVMPVADPVEEFQSSQDSFASSLSSLSSASSYSVLKWSMWLFGNNGMGFGGKRARKSRRNTNSKKSRKGRKGRKGRMTKKGRKHHNTLKRYRTKMRR